MSVSNLDNPARSPGWIIVGYGRVGQSLKLLADRLSADVAATWNRSRSAAEQVVVPSPNARFGELPDALAPLFDEPRLVWLTVVDDAIATVFDVIADRLHPDSMVVHCSGSLPSTAMGEHTELPVASLHPLQAISDPYAAVDRFADSFWSIEGDDAAVDLLCRLVAPANIEPVRIEPDAKILYHASAAVAANLLVSLLDAAIAIAEGADIAPKTARQMLVQLADSSLDNLADTPPAEALTGPAARGDLKTIEKHRRALQRLDDESLPEIYELLTERALEGLAGS